MDQRPQLTTKQREIFTLAVRYYAATGEPCTMSYLSRRLHRNHSTIRAHINAITRKGWATATTPAFQRLVAS